MTYRRKNPARLPAIAALVVCLAWLTASPAGIADPAPTRVSEEDYRQLSARLATLDERLRQIRQTMGRMQEATASLQGAANGELAASTERLAATRNLIEQQRQVLAALIASNSQLPESLSLAELERRQRDSEAERDKLTQKLTEFNDPGEEQGSGLQASTFVSDKEPYPIVLTKGRMVPAVKPYYSFQQDVLCLNRQTHEQLLCVKIKRVRDGTPVAIAIQDGALLDKLIREKSLDADSHVFFLLVCSDSIAAFHQLRQAIKKRGFSFGWRTFRDQTLLRPLNGDTSGDGTTEIEVF